MKKPYSAEWREAGIVYMLCMLAREYMYDTQPKFMGLPIHELYTAFNEKNDFSIEKCMSFPFLLICGTKAESPEREALIRLFDVMPTEHIKKTVIPGFVPSEWKTKICTSAMSPTSILTFNKVCTLTDRMKIDSWFIERNRTSVHHAESLRIDLSIHRNDFDSLVGIIERSGKYNLESRIQALYNINDKEFVDACTWIEETFFFVNHERLLKFATLDEKLLCYWTKNTMIYELYESIVKSPKIIESDLREGLYHALMATRFELSPH